MGSALKQWLFGKGLSADWKQVQAWCEAEGLTFKTTHEQDGFVVEDVGARKDVRLEWGPSQRRYLGQWELRLRALSGLDVHSYAVVMPCGLLDLLEREVFTQITEGTQTVIDEDLPEEMRWLAMGQALQPAQLGPLQGAYSAVGNSSVWVTEWLSDEVADALMSLVQPVKDGAAAGTVGQLPALALLAYRSQLVLRRALSRPRLQDVQAMLGMFDKALSHARALGAQGRDQLDDQPAE
jgi:hypothetical protein